MGRFIRLNVSGGRVDPSDVLPAVLCPDICAALVELNSSDCPGRITGMSHSITTKQDLIEWMRSRNKVIRIPYFFILLFWFAIQDDDHAPAND